jgi:uncharacterized protein with PIN domain
MSDEFCKCVFCNAEVEPVYLYDFESKSYIAFDEHYWCEKCKKMVTADDVHWEYVTYHTTEC